MPPFASETRLAPRWLHAWAIVTAGATVALLALGAVVTTFQVGMADPVWPTMPWHLMLIDWREPSPGFLIEHTHRLAGYIVGCFVIVLTVGLLFTARRGWLKWLGAAALAGVIAQGLLGGFRVRLHARLGVDLAVIHGCFAQIVFSLFVSLAVVTSFRFTGATLPDQAAPSLRRWSLLLTGLIFLQLIWGAVLRHTNGVLAQRMHFLTAFAVVAVAVGFALRARAIPSARPLLRRGLTVLGILVTLQILLGIESWMGKFAGVVMPGLQPPTIGQAATRVAHLLVGSFILATTIALTILVYRPAAHSVPTTERPRNEEAEESYRPMVHQLEGTA
jgi:heme a synthase